MKGPRDPEERRAELIAAACEAEEIFGVDELEEHARRERAKEKEESR